MKTAFVAILILLLIPVAAQAVTLSFSNITNNKSTDAAIGEAQLFVGVTAYGTNQVLFNFFNIGPEASSICDAYFDDGTLFGIAGLIDADDGVGGDPGVDFTQPATPGNLPGGENISPPFVTTESFSADSDPAVQPNGVNPGESLGIYFDLESGGTYDDVLAELGSGVLRIGIRVQGYDSGGSESFVNNPPEVIPEPGTLLLLGSGLIGLAGYGKLGFRRKKE